MTAISDAFARAGLTRIDYEAATAALRFINSGGSREAWMQAFDRAAASKRSGDQSEAARSGHNGCVPASPPKPSDGHVCGVGSDQVTPAIARPPITSSQAANAQSGQVKAAAGDSIPAVGHDKRAQEGHPSDADGGKPILGGDQGPRVGNDQASHVPTQKPFTSGAAVLGVPKRAGRTLPPAREPTQRYVNAIAESRRATAKVQLELLKTSNGVPWGSIRPREFVGMIRDGHMAWAIKEAFGPFNPKQENMELREFLPDAVFRKAITLAELNHVG